MIALRRSSEALARGGLRHVSIGEDAVVYLREHGDERLPAFHIWRLDG